MRARNLTLVLALAMTACTESEVTAPATRDIVPQLSAAPAFGTTTDLEDLLGQPTFSLASGWEAGFRRQVVAQWDDPEALRRIFSRWLTTLVSARLRPANNDNDLFAALADFDSWLLSAETTLPGAETIFAAELDAFDQLAAEKLAQAIDGNLTVCRTNQSFGALANVLFWFEQAEILALPDGPHWTITTDAIRDYIRQFCAAVEIESVAFPNPVDVGQSFTLHTNTAVRFVGQATTQPAAFQMEIGFNPPGTFLPAAYTDATGHYETPMTFTAPGLITVAVFACLVLPGRTVANDNVCASRFPTGNALNPPPPPPPPPTPTVDVSGVWEADFNYNGPAGLVAARMTLTLGQSGSAAGGSWVLDDGIHSGSISFAVGGIDPNCPGCGYLITDFEMTSANGGRWLINLSTGGRHVGDPARGLSMAIDIFGSDSHGPEVIHTWFARRVIFRPVSN